MYVERVYELPEGSRTSIGRSIKNVLNLKPEEKIAALLRLERVTDDDGNDITFREDAGFVFFATRSGKVKKTALNDFRNYRKDGIIAINLEEDNELIGVRLTIRLGRDHPRHPRRHEPALPRRRHPPAWAAELASASWASARATSDFVSASRTRHRRAPRLLVASENGLGKRTAFDDYRQQTPRRQGHHHHEGHRQDRPGRRCRHRHRGGRTHAHDLHRPEHPHPRQRNPRDRPQSPRA